MKTASRAPTANRVDARLLPDVIGLDEQQQLALHWLNAMLIQGNEYVVVKRLLHELLTAQTLLGARRHQERW